jgi:hypothetical protein
MVITRTLASAEWTNWGQREEVFVRFMTTIDDGVDSRVKKWQSARQSKLFGGDIPDPIFAFGQSGP